MWRRWAFWIGAPLAAISLIAGLVSLRWAIWWHHEPTDAEPDFVTLHLSSGGLNFRALWELGPFTVSEDLPRINKRDPSRPTSLGRGFWLDARRQEALMWKAAWVHRSGSTLAWDDASLPLWIPLLAGVGLTAPAILRRRIRKGQCEGCGYDLHANVTGVCSECGRRASDRKA